MVTQTLSNTEKAEWLRAAEDPWEFLTKYGKVNDPPPGQGMIPFSPWPHLFRVVQAIQKTDKLLIGKARRLGLTWLLAGFGIHTAQFTEGARVLYFSKGELEASELIARGRFLWNNLPPLFRPSLGKDQAGYLSFLASGSTIKALPATEDAGRGEDASLVIVDEADYHPYAKENYGAIKPAVDRAGAKIIFVSTFNRLKIDTFFKELWRGAPENGFTKLFLPWDCRPGRDAVWYEAEKASYPDPFQFEKENPASELEALSPSQEACFFSVPMLTALMENAKEGYQFKHYVVGRRYAAWIDPAGMGEDAHSLQMLDCQTGEFVIDFTGKQSIGEFAQRVYNIFQEFNKPLLGIESNGVGLAMIEALKGLGYPDSKLLYQDEKRTKIGVPMTASLRDRILVNLAEGIRQGALVPYSKAALGEMLSFVRQGKGSPQAASGAHDDRVMAMAGANWVAGQVPQQVKTGPGTQQVAWV